MKKPVVFITWPTKEEFGRDQPLEAGFLIDYGCARNVQPGGGHCVDFNLIFDTMIQSGLLDESDKPANVQAYAQKLCENRYHRDIFVRAKVIECDLFDLEVSTETLPTFATSDSSKCWWKAENGILTVQGQGECDPPFGGNVPNDSSLLIFFECNFPHGVSPENWKIFSRNLKRFRKLMRSKLFQNCFQAYGLLVEHCSWKAFSLFARRATFVRS